MYDIFLSHSSANIDWTRRLAEQINNQKVQGRYLRAWLDEQHLQAGDELSPEIEAALQNSCHLGVVLTNAAVQSKWVTYEWNYFNTLKRPGSVIIPLVLEKCDLPVLLSRLIRIDFTDPDYFEASFKLLLARLSSANAPTLEQVKSRTVELLSAAEGVYHGMYADEPTTESDALYAYLTTFDIEDPETEGLVFGAFEAMLDFIDTLADADAYNPTMLVAECLAALITRSPRYSRVIQNWQERPSLTWKFAAIRAYSKLAEIDPQLVDVSGFIYCAADLDRRVVLSKSEENLVGHMARAAGKLQDTPVGVELIRSLARRQAASRLIAAGALSINPASAGAIFMLSELRDLPKRHVEWSSPPADLLGILKELLADSDRTVRETAEYTSYTLKSAYGDLHLEQVPKYQTAAPPTLEIPVRPGRRLPFNGRLNRVTRQNQNSASQHIQPFTIFCLTEIDLMDVLFYGASGLIIPNQPQFSHQCMRLVNAGVPFALLSPQEMDNLPYGQYASVDEDNILRVRR